MVSNCRKTTKYSNVSMDLSDLEFSLINITYGFPRWVEACMVASGTRGLGATDILVLHAANHRAKGRRLAEISMVLNIDDTHLVAYALKKLIAADLVVVKRQGRESHYETTARGDEVCLEYRNVRDQFLVENVKWLIEGRPKTTLSDSTLFLRMLTTIYDQSGRSATAASSPSSPPLRTKR